MNSRFKIFLSFLIFLSTFYIGKAQTNLEVFGQSRVQYRRFDWKYYDAEHFKIYHYDRSGRELARFVAEQAEQDIAAIEKRLGGLFPEKLNIILYNCFDDYQQGNIGLNGQLQIQSDNPSGKLDLVGDKLVIYFTGKHADLKGQLRRGMSKVVMERLMFGENITEMVKNAVLLDLDAWVTEGYIGYVVDGWTGDDDNTWKNLLLAKPKTYFHEIAQQEPEVAGKAFWKFIAVKYGDNNVKNLLYLTQTKSSLDKALSLTIGMNLKTASDSVIRFYKERYAFEEQIFAPIDTSSKLTTITVKHDESRIRDIAVSPRGGDIAYVKWKYGEYQVILEKTKSINGISKRESSVLVNGGVKNHKDVDDPDYPLVAWNNTGFKFGIIFKNRNKLRIRVYNSVLGKIQDFKIPATRFDRITGFTFMEDDDMIIVSAIKNGQSDLFELRLKGGRTNQLTDDAWDDEAPVFVSGGSRKGVVFLSNRPQPYMNIKPLPNELPAGLMNVFFYNSTTKSYDLMQLTNNRKGTITQPIPYGPDHFAYLSNQFGITNRYVVQFARNINNQDSAYSVPMTNFSRNILYQQYNPASGKIADVIRIQDNYEVLFHKIELPAPDGNAIPVKPVPISFIDGVVTRKNATNFTNPINLSTKNDLFQKDESFRIKTGDELQQGEFYTKRDLNSSDSAKVTPDAESEKYAEMMSLRKPADSTSNSTANTGNNNTASNANIATGTLDGKRILYVDSSFIDLRSRKYYLSFKPDFFGIRADNSIVGSRYQSYDNTGGSFTNPSIAGMLTASITDKMEDYRFTGGLRIPVNFSGYTTFFQFENFRRRTDWAILFLRQETKYTYPFVDGSGQTFDEPGKTVMNMVQGSVSYPLDKVKSFRLDFGLRQDRMIIKAIDPIGLVLPNTEQYWATSRAEFVYDDTRNPVMNIYNGLRYKFFAEYFYRIHTNNPYTLTGNPEDNNKPAGLYNIGVDFRYYQKIYKNTIAAFRFAGAHSGGPQKIMYFLGGVDNAINPKSDGSLPPSGNNDYAFQTLATSMRGYNQNARNGNTYALASGEIRFPVFTTLSHNAIQSSILKNLQLVAFTDIGSAWEGVLPNAQNFDRFYHVYYGQTAAQQPVIQVNIPNFNDNGICMGYGLGVRTLLFGYFTRVDYSRNIVGKTHWYLSFGTDF
ncbi:hypothetical protein F0919_11930 [Taibaiella lutea]|uniref:Uncharacterized protein n=1 Tax=Taibaiella lutea TaxID=2608001 RepID=A0A5M6CJG2_9BACT|nr:hypothetical protein F0919_11930 [Taibaiella lutea]